MTEGHKGKFVVLRHRSYASGDVYVGRIAASALRPMLVVPRSCEISQKLSARLSRIVALRAHGPVVTVANRFVGA